MPAIKWVPNKAVLPNLIRRISVLLLVLATTIPASSQKRTNPKIDTNETEVTAFIMVDFDITYGLQIAYRVSVIKKLKLGAGFLYGVNNENGVADGTNGYGAIFADVLGFIGDREKWGIGGQIGKGIYNRDIVTDKIQAGVYYSICGNYRAIVSKKLLFTTSIFFGHRNFHYKKTRYSTSLDYNVLTGLKVGIVF